MSVLLPFVLGAVLGDYIPRTTHSKMTKILKILFVCVCVRKNSLSTENLGISV